MADTEAPIRIVPSSDKVRDALIEALTRALEEAKAGKVEGYVLTVVGSTIRGDSKFVDRLSLIGALHMAIVNVTNDG